MARKDKSRIGRSSISKTIHKALVEFGYASLKLEVVRKCLDHYVEKGRDNMPEGVIGMFVQRELDQVVDAGRDLTQLEND